MPCNRAESMVEERLDEISGASAARAIAIPAWRIERSRATSWRVRSGISSPERAGRAIPIPAPARTCGMTVHHAEAAGSSARQPTPPATRRQPAIARVSGSPGSRDETTAAAGSTLTASAAASGSMLQPETSSRTTRKITAVRDAESSARAAAARNGRGPVGRSGSRPSAGATRSRRAASRATSSPGSTIGAWARKIARQEKAWVRAPPRAGPTAIPNTEAATHIRRPGPGRPPSSSSKAPTSPPAAPSAWIPRRASSTPSALEAPQPIEAAMKSASPAAPTCASP